MIVLGLPILPIIQLIHIFAVNPMGVYSATGGKEGEAGGGRRREGKGVLVSPSAELRANLAAQRENSAPRRQTDKII